MIEILSLQFMQKAIIAGMFLGIMMPFLGVFVTLKRMAFFGDGIAHASLAGIALGFTAVLCGLFLSYYLNLPSGASIILFSATFFFVSVTITSLWSK